MHAVPTGFDTQSHPGPCQGNRFIWAGIRMRSLLLCAISQAPPHSGNLFCESNIYMRVPGCIV